MISKDTYMKVASHNSNNIILCNDTNELERIIKGHNSTIRNMGKRLRDKEHPLDKSLVSDYVLNYELSRLLNKLTRSKLKKDDQYLIGNFEEDSNKLWNKYENGKLKWKNKD